MKATVYGQIEGPKLGLGVRDCAHAWTVFDNVINQSNSIEHNAMYFVVNM